MPQLSRRTLLAAGSACAVFTTAPRLAAQGTFNPDLAAIRKLALSMPGPLPTALNNVNVAASIRPRKLAIEGGDDSAVTMPRTAYQVVYPDGPVMIDSALDIETHGSFRPDKPEPYFPDDFARLKKALDTARLIVLTHFHADHVAGVLTAPNADELARKTIATRQTLQLMMDAPHRPHLKLAARQAGLFNGIEYSGAKVIAPGLVLIEAPGHSADMQMVYIRLASGREYLHSIDAAWIVDNITERKGKAAPWVKEDKGLVSAQLNWLHGLAASDPGLAVLVTHDQAQFDQLRRSGECGALIT
jgi:glyoxylase-like metal-dependent hydrolase (beta-lactamase superfamily II)